MRLTQIDGKLPNLALMRIAAHHRALGDTVELRRTGNPNAQLFDEPFGKVYASLIFEDSLPLAHRVKEVYPSSFIGGPGWSLNTRLEDIGITTLAQDYSLYPLFKDSIGYTQRGCRFRCDFCKVPQMEGRVTEAGSVQDIWRGPAYPRNLLLLDNDFFGQSRWRGLLNDIRDGDFKVCFNQGINARMLTDETAEAIASVKYYDDQFRTRRIYTAWDNQRDEHRLFRGLEALVRYGVKPDQIMVYMLIGHWSGETIQDCDYRRAKLRAFGCRPYPMPKRKTPELLGFQRWVIRRCDLFVSWEDWKAAHYRPENCGIPAEPLLGMF